jgi:hypothetical protein
MEADGVKKGETLGFDVCLAARNAKTSLTECEFLVKGLSLQP